MCFKSYVMDSSLKPSECWDSLDRNLVWYALHQHHKAQWAAGNPLAAITDPGHAYEALASGQQSSVIVGGYLIVYDVSPLWSGTKPIIIEQMVLNLLRRPGNFRTVLQALTELQRKHSACGITVGQGTSDDRLSAVYERYGFRIVAHQLYKE